VVDLAVLVLWLDSMTLKAFSNLNDSMIPNIVKSELSLLKARFKIFFLLSCWFKITLTNLNTGLTKSPALEGNIFVTTFHTV